MVNILAYFVISFRYLQERRLPSAQRKKYNIIIKSITYLYLFIYKQVITELYKYYNN